MTSRTPRRAFYRRSVLVAVCIGIAGAGSCFSEPGPRPQLSPPDADTADASGPSCPPARPLQEGVKCSSVSAESLPSRKIVSCADCPVDVEVFTEDLFNLFKSHCGGCHVENSL